MLVSRNRPVRRPEHVQHLLRARKFFAGRSGRGAAPSFRNINPLPIRVSDNADRALTQTRHQAGGARPRLVIQARQVGEDRIDGKDTVFAIGADNPARAALDPSRDVKARHSSSVGIDHTTVAIGNDTTRPVKRHLGDRDAPIADAAKQNAAGEFVFFARRLGDLVSGRAREAVAHQRHALDLALAVKFNRAPQKLDMATPSLRRGGSCGKCLQHRVALAAGPVAALGEFRPTGIVEFELGSINDRVAVRQFSEFPQLWMRELRLHRAAPADHVDITDFAFGQNFKRMRGDIGLP